MRNYFQTVCSNLVRGCATVVTCANILMRLHTSLNTNALNANTIAVLQKFLTSN